MLKCYIMNTDGNVQLARHFKVKEFGCKDGSPVVFIDDYLYTVLDILRHKLGKPVIITSGYRTPEWNKKCGGAKYSYHMRGMAADIRVDGISAKGNCQQTERNRPGWMRHYRIQKLGAL